MNETPRVGQIMYDPYVRGAHDPWSSPPESAAPSPGQNGTAAQQPAPGAGAPSPSQENIPSDRFQHGLSDQIIGNPISVEEAYLGSMQAMLAREIGAYIGAVFIIGTGQMLRVEGRLTEVGNNYIVIYQQPRQMYVSCDLNSLRFVELFENNPSGAGIQNFQGLSGISNAL